MAVCRNLEASHEIKFFLLRHVVFKNSDIISFRLHLPFCERRKPSQGQVKCLSVYLIQCNHKAGTLRGPCTVSPRTL
jgi:hypothetical protein